MGLLPVHLLRDRRPSFVELYSYDNLGKTNYGTAGYLGHGYFITVKHAVIALQGDRLLVLRDSTGTVATIDLVSGQIRETGIRAPLSGLLRGSARTAGGFLVASDAGVYRID